MIDLLFDFFKTEDEAWLNAPSLENECMILKNFELVNFLSVFLDQ